MKQKLWIVFTVLFLVLSAFFKFVMIGYLFTALMFLFFAAVVVVYHFMNKFGLKKLRIVITVLIVMGCALFVGLEIPIVAASGGSAQNPDYVIVLGAGLKGTEPSRSLLYRLRTAKAYMESHPDCMIIVSGGQGDDEVIPEAEAMHTWLIDNGADPQRILIEDKSESTMENVAFSTRIIRDRGDDPEKLEIAVLSSEYHLYRAKYIARQTGLEVTTVCSHTPNPVLAMNYFIREAFASLYLYVFGIGIE